MNITRLLPLLLLAMVVFSCKDQPKEPETNIKDFVWVASDCADGTDGITLCPYNYLRLYENGSFTGSALRGYVSGTWTNDSLNNQIWLRPLGKNSSEEEATFTVLQILEKKYRKMSVAVTRNAEDFDPERHQTMLLTKNSCNFEYDPFRPDHNLWRNKPTKPETSIEIKDRVLSYLQFLKMFYRFAKENKIENPDTDWFPNPLYLEARGSIRVAYSHELGLWNECFFNEEQAIEGYKVISGPFLNLKLKSNPDLNDRNIIVIDDILSQINAPD
jgi:hypothetical protein